MHPRFNGARRAQATIAGVHFELILAESQRLRFLGLMRLTAEDLEPLLFPRCRSIHMYWMRTPIDVVWLDLDCEAGEAEVLGLTSRIEPRERAGAPKLREPAARRRIGALELPPGRAEAMGLAEGSIVELRIEVEPSG